MAAPWAHPAVKRATRSFRLFDNAGTDASMVESAHERAGGLYRNAASSLASDPRPQAAKVAERMMEHAEMHERQAQEIKAARGPIDTSTVAGKKAAYKALSTRAMATKSASDHVAAARMALSLGKESAGYYQVRAQYHENEAKNASDWDENKHPRDAAGRFA